MNDGSTTEEYFERKKYSERTMSLFSISRRRTELVAKSLFIITSWADGYLSDLRLADLPVLSCGASPWRDQLRSKHR